MDSFIPVGPTMANGLGMALVMSSTTPLVLLDGGWRVEAVSGSFCRAFGLDPVDIVGKPIFAIGGGEWNVPELRALKEASAALRTTVANCEMDFVQQGCAPRQLVLSAHQLDLPDSAGNHAVLGVADVTDLRRGERIKDDLIHDKQLLLQELRHRVANSLQIIASVLMQSARRVQSEEARNHLHDAQRRVMSIATLQHQLAVSDSDDVPIGPYFEELCKSIGASLIGDPSAIRLTVDADGTIMSSAMSISLGLIVTELVINCLKHAFPDRRDGGIIAVDYHTTPTGWRLSVTDNGIGMPISPALITRGLGTGVVNALAKQLHGEVAITDNTPGTRVTIVGQSSPLV
ncbi:sensor histidine kinase [Novosphingobium sp.]|uniref:sensor histidine kinase n=1 Tax=Novosphingobium sp. TaxID=1874826 RepID=UPI0038B8094F